MKKAKRVDAVFNIYQSVKECMREICISYFRGGCSEDFVKGAAHAFSRYYFRYDKNITVTCHIINKKDFSFIEIHVNGMFRNVSYGFRVYDDCEVVVL